jgi:lysozyme
MNPSETCLAFARSKEGCKLTIYPDLNGFATIGWGHKLTHDDIATGRFTNGITQEQADTLFAGDSEPVTGQVNGLDLTLTQGQFDALWDFTYNLGISRTHTLLSHGLDQVPTQLPHWVYAGGKVADGLVTRRAQEVTWWNS